MYMTDKWEGNEYFPINNFKFIEFSNFINTLIFNH